MSRRLFNSVFLSVSVSLCACNYPSEDKAAEARYHAQRAEQKSQEAATESSKSQQAATQSKEAKAEQAKNFVPTTDVPESIRSKN